MDNLFFTSSLEKVFSDTPIGNIPRLAGADALRNEVFSFQIVGRFSRSTRMQVASSGGLPIRLRKVLEVPSLLPAYPQDKQILRRRPGLYPDLLKDFSGSWTLHANETGSLWVSVTIPRDAAPGVYDMDFTFEIENEDTRRMKFPLTIRRAALVGDPLKNTHWFHADCLYTYYRTPCWSRRHWELIEKYLANAVRHGMNMVLTPLWTPPLDTAVGGERPTVQLLDIEETQNGYKFDFSRLSRWIDTARKCGIRYFEMSHFFTQWGAEATPKIEVKTAGGTEKRFGWHVKADDSRYADFLQQLLPELLTFLDRRKLRGKVFFHLSDEPQEAQLSSYRAGRELVKPLLGNYPVLDALSSIDFYRHRLTDYPVPAINHIEPFRKSDVPELWGYFCCSQWDKVPNRFFAQPSARNRIFGILAYLYDLKGFLHWGYNFYYTQYSLEQAINPYLTTDAGGAFPSGDAFLVYPGADGPEDSLRHEVFFEALQDMRALQLLEEKIGRKNVEARIVESAGYRPTMKRYPRSSGFILSLRAAVNAALESGR